VKFFLCSDEKTETWYFSIIDVIEILTGRTYLNDIGANKKETYYRRE
jgi:hypothetical protein